MAFGAITVETPGTAGLALAETNGVAGSDSVGHKFSNDGQTHVRVRNNGAGTINVNWKRGGTKSGIALVSPLIDTIATGVTQDYGPFPRDIYNSVSDEGFMEFFFDTANETDARVSIFN